MIPFFEAHGVEYGVMERGDASEMAHLLAEEFSLYEPMGLAVGLSYDELHRIVSLYCPKAVEEQITIVARDTGTGKMVGAMLTDDFAGGAPPGVEHVIDAFPPIATLLDDLDERYKHGRTIERGEYLHLFMLAVCHRNTGRHIGHHLVQATLENGRRRGYRAAVTEATGSVSQHIFRNTGFEDRIVAPYKEFQFDGRRVFGDIEGHVGTILMDTAIPAGVPVLKIVGAPARAEAMV